MMLRGFRGSGVIQLAILFGAISCVSWITI